MFKQTSKKYILGTYTQMLKNMVIASTVWWHCPDLWQGPKDWLNVIDSLANGPPCFSFAAIYTLSSSFPCWTGLTCMSNRMLWTWWCVSLGAWKALAGTVGWSWLPCSEDKQPGGKAPWGETTNWFPTNTGIIFLTMGMRYIFKQDPPVLIKPLQDLALTNIWPSFMRK